MKRAISIVEQQLPNICIIGDPREKLGDRKKAFEEIMGSVLWEDLQFFKFMYLITEL